MVIVPCQNCLKEFNAKPSWIKMGVGKFCSRICSDTKRRVGQTFNCFICGKQTYKQRKNINKSQTGKFFCTKKCSVAWHNSVFKEENHGNWKNGDFAYKKILIRSEKKRLCFLCIEINTKVLVAHHLDHNRKNNKLENLTWLCLNCHHLVHNYKSEGDNLSVKIKNDE